MEILDKIEKTLKERLYTSGVGFIAGCFFGALIFSRIFMFFNGNSSIIYYIIGGSILAFIFAIIGFLIPRFTQVLVGIISILFILGLGISIGINGFGVGKLIVLIISVIISILDITISILTWEKISRNTY